MQQAYENYNDVVEVPHCKPGHWPEGIPHGRFASHVHKTLPTSCRVAIIGLPDDTGVRLNGGRPGAAFGPTAFRSALSRYGVADPHGWEWPRVLDAGDIEPAHGHTEASLHETHRRVTEATLAVVEAGLFPIAIGGGHDLTFPFVRAVSQALQAKTPGSNLAGIYFDAHLDVRETIGSGMPFRKLIDSCGVQPLLVAGLNPLVNSREHVEWFLEHGGEVAEDDWVTSLSSNDGNEGPELLEPLRDAGNLFCSFDLDVLDGSIAPGVSALNPSGLNVRDAASALFLIASDPRLRCLDFMELCPVHDDQRAPGEHAGRTARVAAHLFLIALMGLSLGPLSQQVEGLD